LIAGKKNRRLSRIVYGEGIVYFHMCLSAHSSGSAKITVYIVVKIC